MKPYLAQIIAHSSIFQGCALEGLLPKPRFRLHHQSSLLLLIGRPDSSRRRLHLEVFTKEPERRRPQNLCGPRGKGKLGFEEGPDGRSLWEGERGLRCGTSSQKKTDARVCETNFELTANPSGHREIRVRSSVHESF